MAGRPVLRRTGAASRTGALTGHEGPGPAASGGQPFGSCCGSPGSCVRWLSCPSCGGHRCDPRPALYWAAGMCLKLDARWAFESRVAPHLPAP